MELIKTERGWPGHYICASDCRFRRNTLLEYGDVRIVVSTVGQKRIKRNGKLEMDKVGCGRYYETMVFHTKYDGMYWDADVHRVVEFESDWQINDIKEESDQEANDMHEAVVKEISNTLIEGESDAIQSSHTTMHR